MLSHLVCSPLRCLTRLSSVGLKGAFKESGIKTVVPVVSKFRTKMISIVRINVGREDFKKEDLNELLF